MRVSPINPRQLNLLTELAARPNGGPPAQVRVASYMRHMTRDDTEGNFQVGQSKTV